MVGISHQEHQFDVCVIGGGMAGICAAIAAARNGARTALVHDRSVLGGNASSEVRMWICGAHGKNNKETGILEEIQLDNQYYNATLRYSVWDSVLWGKVHFQPNLTSFFNCSCTGASMNEAGATDEGTIKSIDAWQLTSQTPHHIEANYFIDCSGDSILAGLTPAAFRHGREAREEFDEDIQPETADGKTMGNSLLIQWRRTGKPQKYVAPPWAYKFTTQEDLPCRIEGVDAHNFWWVEVGGLGDTIKDAEAIHDELMKVIYGVWDYIKNYAPKRETADDWELEWVGSLPGKRENRRYEGEHILDQNDIRSGGHFHDVVAYGGWTMDDHHPAGIYYPGRPTVFHPAPSPYGIPYRCLYSRNVPNLLFAGRNISVTHAALSSTRVMATCAILGQAAGTAAALCVRHNCAPRFLSRGERLEELQRTLMNDDCWLPGILRPQDPLTCSGTLIGDGENLSALTDGIDRDREEEHAWTGGLGSELLYEWAAPVEIAGVRMVFDSNLANTKRQPCSYPQWTDKARVPGSLVRGFRLEIRDETGHWKQVYRNENNFHRLVEIPIGAKADTLRLVVESTWGDSHARIFAFEPMGNFTPKIPTNPQGIPFSERRAQINPEDLKPPENGAETTKSTRSGA